jgi:hypothetical protein
VPRADEETKIRAAAHCVGLLNELEAVLCGWVLELDREWVAKCLDPIYRKLDEE